MAQNDTSFLTIHSKMYFISEIDHSMVLMDEEGNQFDHYDNYIVVNNKGKEIKIPYESNYIFWDEYDENMNVTKKVYKIIIEVTKNKANKKQFKLWKVYSKNKLLYDATKKNPFEP